MNELDEGRDQPSPTCRCAWGGSFRSPQHGLRRWPSRGTAGAGSAAKNTTVLAQISAYLPAGGGEGPCENVCVATGDILDIVVGLRRVCGVGLASRGILQPFWGRGVRRRAPKTWMGKAGEFRLSTERIGAYRRT